MERKDFRTVANRPGADSFFRSLPMMALLEDKITRKDYENDGNGERPEKSLRNGERPETGKEGDKTTTPLDPIH